MLAWAMLTLGGNWANGAVVYWTGDRDGYWTTLSGTDSNWSLSAAVNSDYGKTVQPGDDVHFYASGAANLTTSLGANFSIASLTMDAAATSPVAVLQGASGALTIGGGGITLASGAGSLTISAPIVLGASQAWTNNSSTNKLSINGAINRSTNNYTVDFAGNTISSATLSNGSDTGMIGGWATFAGAGWAAMNGTNVTAYGGYTAIIGSQKITDDVSATLNYRINNSSSSSVGLANPGTTDVNTLMMDGTSARTINIGAEKTLRVGKVGGVLLAAGAGSLTIGVSGSAGKLQGGGAAANSAGEMLLTNFSSNTLLVNAAIVDNGVQPLTLTKAGSGTLILAGSNTYSGPTAIHAGALQVGGGGATGNLGSGNTLNDALLTFKLAGTGAYSGAISGAGGLNVLSGTITLGGGNTYSGGTSVTQGLLKAAHNQALPAGGNVQLNAGLDVNGFALALGALTGGGTVTNNGATGAALTLSSTRAALTFSGLLQDGAKALGLVKSGTGTLALTRSTGNLYSGGTTVSGGAVAIGNTANSALGSGNVAVLAGGTLSGAGRVELGSGKTLSVAASGALAPGLAKGDASETLSVNVAPTFSDDALLQIDVRGNNSGSGLAAVYHDYLQITAGDLHLGGAADSGYGQALLSLALSGTHQAGEYIKIVDLFDAAGKLYGEFRNFGQNERWHDAASGFDWWLLYRVDYNAATGALMAGNDVIITNVPEPSTIAMLLGAACLGLAAAWRRRGARPAAGGA